MIRNRVLILYLCAGAACLSQTTTPAGDTAWSIHFQATSIGQEHGAFQALYSGTNSLPSVAEHRASVTGTVFLALRLNSHWDFVFDPELAGGRGFGYVTGIAGFTNGEIPRVSSATPTLYVARGYARYTIPLGPETEIVEGAANQASGSRPVERLSLITGKFAMTDFFDNDSYSHDPRSQFMNWALMYNGAWDYPADTRGYTMGTLQELDMRNWALRTAVVMEPTRRTAPRSIPGSAGIAVLRSNSSTPIASAGVAESFGFWRSRTKRTPAVTVRLSWRPRPARFPISVQLGEMERKNTASA